MTAESELELTGLTQAGAPLSFHLRLHAYLFGVYVGTRLIATTWIATVLVGVIAVDGESWFAVALVLTILSLCLFMVLAFVVAGALGDGEPGRRPLIWMCITDQLFFTGLTCALGTGHSTTPLLATILPSFFATLLAGLEVGLPLAVFNGVAIGAASATAISATAIRPDWPIFVGYGFLYCVPAWMFNRVLTSTKLLEYRIQRRVQRHSDLVAGALRAEGETGRILELLHRAEAGLWKLVQLLRVRGNGRVVDVEEHIADAELAASAWRLALRIRKDIAPLRESPPLR